MSPRMDPERLSRHLAAVTDGLPARPVPREIIVRRARRRRAMRAAVAGAASAAVVTGAVALAGGVGSGESRLQPSSPAPSSSTPSGTIPTAATPTATNRPTPSAPLPDLPPAEGPMPSFFVSTSGGRVVVVDSSTGRVRRALTPAPADGGPGDHAAWLVPDAPTPAVWFLRPRNNCNDDVVSVPLAGGPAIPVVRAPHGLDISWFAPSRDGRAVAYVVTGCHVASHAGPHIEVRTIATGAVRSIRLPGNLSPGNLALSGDRLAFTAQSSRPPQGPRLYVVDVSTLGADNRLADVAHEVARRSPSCSWGSPAWAHGGTALLATETCMTGSWPSTIIQLDPSNLRPVYQGPQVASDLGVDGMASDDGGHVIVWRSGGDQVGDYVTVDGMRAREVPNDSCTSTDAQPDPCRRAPSW